MPEYTLLALGILAFCAGLAIRRVPLNHKSLLFFGVGIALLAQLLLDNLMTFLGLWAFNPNSILGVYVPVIPAENLLFGAAMFLFTVSVWESGIAQPNVNE
ncbi:MAG: lycopene cyclase domain-containing protein [Candidatus Diapherotrites archaeon]|nr:lycopene cyclase domain-containing protein [Candidatus Diapherotrites archaeon]